MTSYSTEVKGVSSLPNIAPAQMNTGSSTGDVINTLDFGLRAYNMMQQREAQEAQALKAEQTQLNVSEGMLAFNQLRAGMSQFDNPTAATAYYNKQMSQLLKDNAGNLDFLAGVDKARGAAGLKSQAQMAQDEELARESAIREQDMKFRQAGVEALTSKYVELGVPVEDIEEFVSAHSEEEMIEYGMVSGARVRAAEMKARQLENEAKEMANASKQTEMTFTETSRRVAADFNIKLNEGTDALRKLSSGMNNAGDDKSLIKNAEVMNNAIKAQRGIMQQYLSGLTKDELATIDMSKMQADIDARFKMFDALTDPNKVTQYNSAIRAALMQDFFTSMLNSKDDNIVALGMNMSLGLPTNPAIQTAATEQMVLNGTTGELHKAMTIGQVMQGNPAAIEDTLGQNLPETKAEYVDYADLVQTYLATSYNPSYNQSPTLVGESMKWLQRMIDEGQVDAFQQAAIESGRDANYGATKMLTNYVTNSLIPSVLSRETDAMSKGNLSMKYEEGKVVFYATGGTESVGYPTWHGGRIGDMPHQRQVMQKASNQLNSYLEITSNFTGIDKELLVKDVFRVVNR